MCGSYALSYHKLLLEHAQTLSSYPALTPTAFASRLRRELQELLTVVTVTYANDYRTWANDQLRRANPTPTLTYPLFPRRSTIAYHDPAQSTEDIMDAENTVDIMKLRTPQYKVRIPQCNHDQHTDGNLQVYTAEILNQFWIYLSHPCPYHKVIINLSGIQQPPLSAIQTCTTSQTPRHHR